MAYFSIMKLVILPALLSILTFASIQCAVVDQEVRNAKNETIFRVLDRNKLQVPNRHRSFKPAIKFSFHEKSVEKILQVQENLSLNWNLQLNDESSLDISLKEIDNTTSEYLFNWHGANGSGREICFHYAFNDAHWYNGYQSRTPSWPMNTNKAIPKQQFNFLLDYDRYYEDNPHKEAVLIQEHLFVNSDGFAILFEHNSPLFISSNSTGSDDPTLCFSVNSSFPYNEHFNESAYFDIKFHLIASQNARTAIDYLVHHSGLIPIPKTISDASMFTQSTWFTWEMINYGDSSARQLSDEIVNHNFSSKNDLIVLHGWHAHEFDLLAQAEVNPHNSSLNGMHSQGFRVGIHLYNPDLLNLELSKQYGMKSTSLIDFTKSESVKYFSEKLTNVLRTKSIDSLLLSGNMRIVGYFEVNDTSVQNFPNSLTRKYVETVRQSTNATVISEYAFQGQHLPVWLRLSNYWNTSYDQLLQELIPNALSVSMAGYSFFLPYSAGGFCAGNKPSEEHFIRMVQAIALMPGMSLTKKPWIYSAKAVELTKKYLQLHVEHAPAMIELAKKRIQDGSPIIRPMWYVTPEDPKTYTIGDQYMLGDDILVAPVLKIGQVERPVYLPSGTWIDQRGKSYQGPVEVKVSAPLDEMPYFKRKL